MTFNPALRRLRHWFAIVLILTYCTKAAARPTEVLNVPVDDGIEIAVEIYLPNSRPKVLILMVPGTDGLGDSGLGNTIQANPPDYDNHEGWTQEFTKRGYAVAYYYNRGISRPQTCITGNSFEERRDAFVEKCIDGKVRTSLSLHQVTEDYQKVAERTAMYASQQGAPFVVIAASEGIHHVSKVLSKGYPKIAAIVGLSAPMTSLSDIFLYQLFRRQIFNALREAFSNCDVDEVALEELAKCVATPRNKAVLPDLLEVFAPNGKLIQRAHIDRLELEWFNYQSAVLNAIKNADPELYSAGSSFQGRAIPRAFSARYIKESLEECDSIAVRFSRFYDGPIVLIYGDGDYLLTEAAMKPPNRDNVEVVYVGNVGHSLKDPVSNSISPHVVMAIRRVLEKVELAAGAK